MRTRRSDVGVRSAPVHPGASWLPLTQRQVASLVKCVVCVSVVRVCGSCLCAVLGMLSFHHNLAYWPLFTVVRCSFAEYAWAAPNTPFHRGGTCCHRHGYCTPAAAASSTASCCAVCSWRDLRRTDWSRSHLARLHSVPYTLYMII